MKIKQKETDPPSLGPDGPANPADRPSRPGPPPPAASLPCSPDPGRNRGASPPHPLADDDEEIRSPAPPPPRSLLPLAPTLASVLAPLLPQINPYPLPLLRFGEETDGVAAVLRRSRGHRAPIATSPCRTPSPPSTTSPPPLR